MAAPTREELDEFIEEILGDKLAGWQEFEERLRRRRRDLGVVLALCAGVSAAALYFGSDQVVGALTSLGLGVAIWFGYWVKHRLAERPFDYDEDLLSPLIYFVYPRWKLSREDSGELRIDGASPELSWEMRAPSGQEVREVAVRVRALRGSLEGEETLETKIALSLNPLEVNRRDPVQSTEALLEFGDTLSELLERVSLAYEREE